MVAWDANQFSSRLARGLARPLDRSSRAGGRLPDPAPASQERHSSIFLKIDTASEASTTGVT